MRLEEAFRLQAWVDGELSAADSRDVEAWVARDAVARALADDLQQARAMAEVGEPERRVPESREFYWSKIAREIERTARPSATAAARAPWWQSWLMPAGAVAALSLVVFGWMVRSGFGSRSAYLAIGHEIETPLAGMSSITFRSESARMTVVWVKWEPK